MTRKCWWSGAFMVLVVTATAAAQTPRPTVMFRNGSTVNLFAGAATAPTPSRPAAIGGGAVGWDLTPRFAIEGSGEWMEWGSGSHGFAAAMTAQAGLAGGRDLMPFVTGGIGLYHASFDRPGARMPDFYNRRMMMNSSRVGTTAGFTDPTVVFGGGVNAFVNRHWAIRPDVREMVVLRNSRSHFVTALAVHVAYHFEDHPVTPKVR